MSADKKKGPATITEIEGLVVGKKTSVGSKSEHMAVYLDTGEKSFILRLKGDNPFSHEKLSKLIGKKVIASGFFKDYIFFASSAKEI
jgi:spore coat polysaccharide biosynthesis protein SpsF (cytidylyltransferase family)